MTSLCVLLSKDLLNASVSNHISSQLYFQDDLTLMKSWYVNGRNYSHTCEDWLKKQDRNNKQGLLELENDAEKKGLDREEGRKAFYRYDFTQSLSWRKHTSSMEFLTIGSVYSTWHVQNYLP